MCRSLTRIRVKDLDEVYGDAWEHPDSSEYAVGATVGRLTEQLSGILGSLEGREVLDYGAGRGELARTLAAQGARASVYEPYGFDPHIAGVAWYSSWDQIPGDQLFDVIFMIEVIEHLPNPTESLSILRERLRPGGTLFITTPNAAGMNARVRSGNWREADNPTHLCLFTPAGLRACSSRAGFSDLRRDYTPLDFGHGTLRKALGNVLQRLRLDGSLRAELTLP